MVKNFARWFRRADGRQESLAQSIKQNNRRQNNDGLGPLFCRRSFCKSDSPSLTFRAATAAAGLDQENAGIPEPLWNAQWQAGSA